MHKTLKFRPHLIPLIFSGKKNVTWRLFDDKDIQEGDVIDMLNWETKEKFAECVATSVKARTFGEIGPVELTGHEEFSTRDEMLATYKKYYGDKVNWNAEVKVINFKLLPVN